MEKDNILEKCKAVIDYAIGTLNLTNKLNDNWIKVHSGRAYSLLNQLKVLRKEIESLE